MGSGKGHLITALVSCAAGWWMAAHEAPVPAHASAADAAVPAVVAAARTVPADNGPTIAVSSDGRVTLRVEQQPLEWVLEQIAAQAGPGRAGLHECAAKPGAASATAAAPAGGASTAAAIAQRPPEAHARQPDAAQREARLRRAIEQGVEPERYAGLLRARSDGITVPDELLKSLYEYDPSERVRMLAFEAYLEPLADSPEAMHQVLRDALQLPDAAIRHEAASRLEELVANERADALAAQEDP